MEDRIAASVQKLVKRVRDTAGSRGAVRQEKAPPTGQP